MERKLNKSATFQEPPSNKSARVLDKSKSSSFYQASDRGSVAHRKTVNQLAHKDEHAAFHNLDEHQLPKALDSTFDFVCTCNAAGKMERLKAKTIQIYKDATEAKADAKAAVRAEMEAHIEKELHRKDEACKKKEEELQRSIKSLEEAKKRLQWELQDQKSKLTTQLQKLTQENKELSKRNEELRHDDTHLRKEQQERALMEALEKERKARGLAEERMRATERQMQDKDVFLDQREREMQRKEDELNKKLERYNADVIAGFTGKAADRGPNILDVASLLYPSSQKAVTSLAICQVQPDANVSRCKSFAQNASHAANALRNLPTLHRCPSDHDVLVKEVHAFLQEEERHRSLTRGPMSARGPQSSSLDPRIPGQSDSFHDVGDLSMYRNWSRSPRRTTEDSTSQKNFEKKGWGVMQSLKNYSTDARTAQSTSTMSPQQTPPTSARTMTESPGLSPHQTPPLLLRDGDRSSNKVGSGGKLWSNTPRKPCGFEMPARGNSPYPDITRMMAEGIPRMAGPYYKQ